VELAHLRLDRVSHAQLVVLAHDELVSVGELLLARLVAVGAEHAIQRRREAGVDAQLPERRAQPLGVRAVLPLHQQAEPDQVAHEPRGDHARAQLVADLRRPADERFLLRDPMPARREQPQPHVVGIPTQVGAKGCELAPRIGVDRAAHDAEDPLLRQQQPVDRSEAGSRVDAGARGRQVVVGHEDLHPRSPAVVGRANGVDAENVRSPPEQRRRARPGPDERLDDIVVEARIELKARDELRSRHPA
jgi:hypothetical protein